MAICPFCSSDYLERIGQDYYICHACGEEFELYGNGDYYQDQDWDM